MKLLFLEKLISKNPGIYKLIISGKTYVGSSICLNERLNDHKTTLKNNKSSSIYLQRCFNKHGKENLYFEILYEWEKTYPTKIELLQKEKYYIDLLNPEFNLERDPTTQFNIRTTSKKVYQYDKLTGNFIQEFPSCREAERKYNCKGVSLVANERHTKYKTAGGFMWKYYKKNKIESYVNNSDKAKIVPITVYSILGYKIKTYPSIASCVKEMFPNGKFNSICATISSICKGESISHNSYRFSYNDLDKLDNSVLSKFMKNCPILQINKETNIPIKIWNNWADITREFDVKWTFKKQLLFQKSFYKKVHKIHEYKWLSLDTASQFGELLERLEN